MDWTTREHETVLSVLSAEPVDLAKLKYSPDNNYMLTLKKKKTQSEKVRAEGLGGLTRASKSERRDRP